MFSVSWSGTLALGDFTFYGVFKLVHPLNWPEFPWKFHTVTMKFMGLKRLIFSCNTTNTKQREENLLQLPLVILNYIYEDFNHWPALAFVKVHNYWLEAMNYICQKRTFSLINILCTLKKIEKSSPLNCAGILIWSSNLILITFLSQKLTRINSISSTHQYPSFKKWWLCNILL